MSEGEHKRVRILVVDDDPAAVELLTAYLEPGGYDVLSAQNGAEALRILAAEGPPMVITNWMMPEMDGLQLCRTIRAHEGIPFAYVIVVTGRTDEEGLIEAFDAGADDYLAKPVNRRELLARMRAGERVIQLHEDVERRNREVHLINAEMAVAHRKLTEANETLNRMATTDELTGLLNRREALTRLEECWASAERHGHPLACISVDIDHFKSFNDVYGHAVGDLVLRETAGILRKNARKQEKVCRIGGEEFLILCPHADEEQAATGAERIRQAIESNIVQSGDLELSVTVSLGVAQRTPEMVSADHLLRAADEALYSAKDAGRNRVCLAGDRPDLPAPGEKLNVMGGGPRETPSAGGGVDEPATVLVADDASSIRTLCRKLLERDGFWVIEAADGVDALDKIDGNRPDVIVMDAIMPQMTGLDCTRTLKANPETCGIPIVMTSARKDQTDAETCLDAGADDFLKKPIDSKELIFRVRSMLRLGRRGSELVQSYEVRGEQSRALSLLLDYTRDLGTISNLDEVLDRTVITLAGLTCCGCVTIMLPDANNEFLTVARAIGIHDQACADLRVPIGSPTSGQVYATGIPVVLNHGEQPPHGGHGGDAGLLPTPPFASIPLTVGGQVLGVLNIADRQGKGSFEAHELAYVDLVCSVAAGMIGHHRRDRAVDEVRHTLSRAIASTPEPAPNSPVGVILPDQA